jgi:putative peptidoglycan lipid II flippase
VNGRAGWARAFAAPGRALTVLVLALTGALTVPVLIVRPPAATAVTRATPASLALPAAALPAAEAPALPVTISLSSISPVALTPDGALTVSGSLRNTGRTTLTGLQVNLRLGWKPLIERRELAAWAALPAQDASVGVLQAASPLATALLPGQSQGFSVTMRGDSVQLPATVQAFGPRGMSVEVQQRSDGIRRVGIVRTFIVWDPVPAPPVTKLSLLVPVTAGDAPLDSTGTGHNPAGLWSPGSRLSQLLTAAADAAFTYAVDPAVPAAAQAAQSPVPSRFSGEVAHRDGDSPGPGPSGSGSGSTPGPSPGAASERPVTPAPSAVPGAGETTPATTPAAAASIAFNPQAAAQAASWLKDFTAATRGRQTISLPYGDPDVAALAGAGHGSLVDLAEQVGATASRQALGTDLPRGLIWPASGRADATTAALAAHAPGRVLVLPSSAVTPSGGVPVHGDIAVPDGEAEVLFTDDALSAAAAGMGGASATLATQRLLAETAVLATTARSTPLTGAGGAAAGTPSAVAVAALPRDWNPDPVTVQSSLSALRAAGWISLADLDTARASPAVAVSRSRLLRPSPAEQPARLGAAAVEAVAGQLHRLQGFATALDAAGDAKVAEPTRRTGLELLSTSWTARQSQLGGIDRRGSPLWELADQVDGLYFGVRVSDGSSVNLIASTGQRVVTILNKLAVPVVISLNLHATSGRVHVRSIEPVRLDAGKNRTVVVRLDAIANGETTIVGTLTARSAKGPVIGTTPTIAVSVHREWETRVLTWLGGAVLLLFLAGFSRNVRRGRGRERISPDAVPDPDDVGRVPPAGSPEPKAANGAAADIEAPDPAPGAPADPASGNSAPLERACELPRTGAASSGGGLALAARISRLQLTHRAGAGGPAEPEPGTPAGSVTGGPLPGPPAGAAAGSSTSRLLSSSAVMAAGTLTSRVLGVVRVAVLAWAIGVGFTADPFSVANTLPNNLFILIGGGVLNAILVPQIVRAATHSDGGQEYVDRLVTLAIAILGGATLLATAGAPVLIRLYEDGWHAEQVSLATGFALWCLPQIFFYGLYTIYGQILNARGSFGPFMWAPVVNNVVAIAGCVVFVGLYGSGGRRASWWGAGPVAVLAGTATFGVVAQALVLIPALRRAGYRWRPRWGVRGMGMRTAGTVAGWTFGGVVVGQLAFLLISQLSTNAAATAAARGGSGRGRAVWDNAYLLFFLPHSLAAVSLVTAVFTRMAAAAGSGRTDDVRADVSLGVRLTGVATVISTVAFVVLGRDLARAVFFKSPPQQTDDIALVAGAMVLGLVAFSATYMFSRAYYAYEDARTPFVVQVVVVLVWTAGSVAAAQVLPADWVTPGIGLAMSLGNVVGVVLAGALLRRRLGGLDGARLVRTHVQLLVAALTAGVVAWFAGSSLHALLGVGTAASILVLVIAGGALVAVYAGMLRLMRVEEFALISKPLLRRVRG